MWWRLFVSREVFWKLYGLAVVFVLYVVEFVQMVSIGVLSVHVPLSDGT